jgi:ribosomal protein S11
VIPGVYAVILVYSTSYAIRAERVLHLAGIQTKLIPVPRHLSSNCGVCVRIAQHDREAAQQALLQAGVEVEGIYDLE